MTPPKFGRFLTSFPHRHTLLLQIFLPLPQLPKKIYSVFHQFRQAKFAYGGSNFKLELVFATVPEASKNDIYYKSGQN
jgi:hypothetical protein